MPFIISFLEPYQKLRILTFFDPDKDPLGDQDIKLFSLKLQ